MAGDDQWIAIACATDEHWQALREILADVIPADGLDTLAERKAREDQLDAVLATWTAESEPFALQARLIEAGIPAHVLLNAQTSFSDPQYQHRQHFISVPHSIAGDSVVENTRFRLHGTPAVIDRGPPATGEHNVEVLMEVLGYDGDKVADVLASLCME